MTPIARLIHRATIATLRLALLAIVVIAAPFLYAQEASQHAADDSTATLVRQVRDATREFIDVNNATAAGYGPFLGCVTGPDHGAMGIHYVNGTLLGETQLDASKPQALIYEPVNGKLRLVGVEFIVDAAIWLASTATPRQYSMDKSSSSSALPIVSTSPRSSSYTSGLGGITPKARSWTGTIT